jgi:hypothetical protein
MLIFGMEIEASRWPWQKGYNWRGHVGASPYKGQIASNRFIGNYNYRLGVMASPDTGVACDLLFGTISVHHAPRCAHCGERMKRRERSIRYWHKVQLLGRGPEGAGTAPENMMHKRCAIALEPWNHV